MTANAGVGQFQKDVQARWDSTGNVPVPDDSALMTVALDACDKWAAGADDAAVQGPLMSLYGALNGTLLVLDAVTYVCPQYQSIVSG